MRDIPLVVGTCHWVVLLVIDLIVALSLLILFILTIFAIRARFFTFDILTAIVLLELILFVGPVVRSFRAPKRTRICKRIGQTALLIVQMFWTDCQSACVDRYN